MLSCQDHPSMRTLASAPSVLSSLLRSLPLKLSTQPFSHGLPGSMWAALAPAPLIHPFTAIAANSGPWSD